MSRGKTPVRIAAVAGLAAAVLALLLVVLLSGDGSHRYQLILQNASQLVPDNQVLIGGQPAGSVGSIDLTEDNLARIEISVEQQLHEGTIATVRATSLSGVANNYVSISPGPNSNPALEDGATLGLDETVTPVDLDAFINAFPRSVRRGLRQFIRGNAQIYAARGPEANRTYKYFGPALNRTGAFLSELNRDQRLFERFVVSSSKLATAIAERGESLSSAIANASTAFGAIAAENRAFGETLELLPPTLRQSNTTFVNLRAALDDLDPLIETAKPATKDLAPFLRELRPVLARAVPVFRDLRLTVSRRGFANDAAELLAFLPPVRKRASVAFPRSEQAIEDFQPTLNFARAYTPDIFNGFGKVGQIAGYYDANGHYARVGLAGLGIFAFEGDGEELDPIPPSAQFDAYGESAPVTRRCPGGASQPAPDGSSPFTEPPFPGAGVKPGAECDPDDAPPGP